VDFWATVRVVVRRWYAVLPMLLLTLAAVAGMYLTSPTTYESRSVLLLHIPVTGGMVYENGYRPDQTNPLLNYNSNLDITGTVLIQSMHTLDFAERIGVPDDGTIFTVNNGSDNPEALSTGPFVFITVDGPDADAAQALVRRAVTEASAELDRRQATIKAPRSTYVQLTEIVPASIAEPQRGSKLRAVGAALALGLVLTLATAFAAESGARARRLRKRAIDGDIDGVVDAGFRETDTAERPRSPAMVGRNGSGRDV
jgi:hypothetical protein